MALTKETLTDKVRRRLPAGMRGRVGDIQSAIIEGLKDVSRAHINSDARVVLEITVNVTLGAPDASGIQSGALPSTILAESVRDGDVTHADLSRPLVKKKSVGDLAYLWSQSVLGFFSVHDGRLYARRPAGALATGTPAVARGVRLFGASGNIATELALVPVQLEPDVVDAVAQRVMGGAPSGEAV